MKEFKDKVAVITGAASGLGRAMAERCAQEGMKVVLADVEVEPLAKTESSMKASGATVLAVKTDVSRATDVEDLAQKTLEAFGMSTCSATTPVSVRALPSGKAPSLSGNGSSASISGA